MSVVIVVCCCVSATGRSLAQRSPTEFGVSECDREEALAHWGAVDPWEGGVGAPLCLCLKLSTVAGTVVIMYYRYTGSLFYLTFVVTSVGSFVVLT
jgi:hypothetical protein